MKTHRIRPWVASLTSALTLGVLLSAALTSGCASPRLVLHPEDTGPDGSGSVRQSFVEPHRIEVIVDGQVYTGEWRSQEARDHPLAQTYLHKRAVGRVVTTLMSSKGRRMHCNWLVDGLHGHGTCEDEGHRKFDVTIG